MKRKLTKKEIYSIIRHESETGYSNLACELSLNPNSDIYGEFENKKLIMYSFKRRK